MQHLNAGFRCGHTCIILPFLGDWFSTRCSSQPPRHGARLTGSAHASTESLAPRLDRPRVVGFGLGCCLRRRVRPSHLHPDPLGWQAERCTASGQGWERPLSGRHAALSQRRRRGVPGLSRHARLAEPSLCGGRAEARRSRAVHGGRESEVVEGAGLVGPLLELSRRAGRHSGRRDRRRQRAHHALGRALRSARGSEPARPRPRTRPLPPATGICATAVTSPPD